MNSTFLDGRLATSNGYQIAEKMLNYAGITINGNAPQDIQIKETAFFQRVLREGSMGLGESYVDGWWDCERLDIFFHHILSAHLDRRLPRRFRDLIRLIAARIFNYQTIKRAWTVGKMHYDLGNDLFSSMLDSLMQYSCGYWKSATTLEEAQQDKLQMICEKLQLKPGMRLLDIGCGWGGLAQFAAQRYGVSVQGVTISLEQQKIAKQRCEGLDVAILLQDYRKLNQQYDRIVSVGMFEHVGPKNYQTFFNIVSRNLKPNGLFLLHTIGSNYTNYNVDPWINKYIFANGCLPSIVQIASKTEGLFVMEDWHNFGADYDRTLMAWYARFRQNWSQLEAHYGEHFYRMFSYYLNACAGAFRARNIQLWQILFSPKGVVGGVRAPR